MKQIIQNVHRLFNSIVDVRKFLVKTSCLQNTISTKHLETHSNPPLRMTTLKQDRAFLFILIYLILSTIAMKIFLFSRHSALFKHLTNYFLSKSTLPGGSKRLQLSIPS
jgi:hypothetical protein